MKLLKIDWGSLEMAFDETLLGSDWLTERSNYFDLETGGVVFIDEDFVDALERVEAELEYQLSEKAEVTPGMVQGTQAYQSLPSWQQNRLLEAANLHFGDANRYTDIPRFESQESYEHMEEFIETVRDAAMQERLSRAIREHRPFRRFRDVLATDRRLEHEWHAYEQRRQRATIIEWLHSIGVEPANPEDMLGLSPLPELRKIMFAEVRRFVRFARDVPGVSRIALIGSLTTSKEFPKDIDLLVTVADDCDLSPVARLGRQLSGHMLTYQAGADVFLADPAGNYLGRTCPWKRCGPGNRLNCDALHCGARQFLHDDLSAVRLKKKLVAHPPVILWPRPAAAADVPADVCAELIEKLASDEQ